MASEARAGWRSIVKRRCRLAWIGGAPHVPVSITGGWRVTSLRRRSSQKRASRRTVPSQGATGRPDEQVATDQTHPRHPRWPFSCTAVWPNRRIVSRDIDLRARRWQRCLLALSSEAGVPQLVIASSGRVRSGEGTATGRHLEHAVVRINLEPGGSTPGLQIHSRQRSPRSSRLSDRNCFPRKPHRIARREPPVDSNRPGQQWTDVRGQAGERSQAPGRGQADLAVEYPV